MKAAVFETFGGPGVVRIANVPVPEPGPREVRVRVVAAALNHLDLWVRRGLPIETPMPHIGGSDVAGIVDDVGDDVDPAHLGRRVVVNPTLSCGECEACERGQPPLCPRLRILGEHTQGGFAEYVVVPAANLHGVPDGFPLERAAAVPLAFATAWRGLVSRADLREAESILITGASGGVATAAIRIANMIGAEVHAVTSTRNVERVEALGVHRVHDRERVDFSREVWNETGKRGVDVVFDSVGEATWPACIRCLTRGGRLVVYGATTGHDATTDLRLVFYKQLSILGTTMSNPVEFRTVMDTIFSGRLVPVVDRILPLERVAQAHALLENGDVFGKIILRVDEGDLA